VVLKKKRNAQKIFLLSPLEKILLSVCLSLFLSLSLSLSLSLYNELDGATRGRDDAWV